MTYLGYLFIIFGLFGIISGIMGLYRLPDFYTKLHAASIIECFGIPLCFIGLALMQSEFTSFFKLILISVLILLLNPVSSHALGRASVQYKIDKDGRIK